MMDLEPKKKEYRYIYLLVSYKSFEDYSTNDTIIS